MDVDIFRRCRGCRNERAVLLDQPVESEVGGALYQGIGHISQVFLVTGEAVLFIKVLGEPGTAQGPVEPLGVAHTATGDIDCALLTRGMTNKVCLVVPGNKSGPRHFPAVGPGREPIQTTHTGEPQHACRPTSQVPAE